MPKPLAPAVLRDLVLRELCIHPSQALVVELAGGFAGSSDFAYKRFRRLFSCIRASMKAVRGKRREIMRVQPSLTLAASMQPRITIVPIEDYICTPSGNDLRRFYRGGPVAVTRKPLCRCCCCLLPLPAVTGPCRKPFPQLAAQLGESPRHSCEHYQHLIMHAQGPHNSFNHFQKRHCTHYRPRRVQHLQ
jgi:hypothetical protein